MSPLPNGWPTFQEVRDGKRPPGGWPWEPLALEDPALIEELDRKWRGERIERRRAEAERDQLRAELNVLYGTMEADMQAVIESQVASILEAARVDGWEG